MIIFPANHGKKFWLHPPKMSVEAAVACAGTAFVAIMLAMTAIYAGPLWRDEVNTANLAQMPSLSEFWNNLTCESFPPLMPLLLRGCGLLGLAGNDLSIRLLGLSVGFFFLISLWLCSRWMGSRAPILSIALLGSLPAFYFILGANRAYGLASCFLMLSFGGIWRMVEIPSRTNMFWAGLTSFLFVHCVYYDVVFLCAMLAGGAYVTVRHRQWKSLLALAGIGTACASSLGIYLPVIQRGSINLPMNQVPFFNFSLLWHELNKAVSGQTSGSLSGIRDTEIWLWFGLFLGGLILAMVIQRDHPQPLTDPKIAAASCIRADRARFCAVAMVFGTIGFFAFLLRLHYPTQTWYYFELICLWAISLDGLLGSAWPDLRPWGMLRIGFMVFIMAWSAWPVWIEAHTRRSNMDVIASILGKNASEGDLILVESAWEGITFNRYYRGSARWMTIPPIDSHLVHRNDLVFKMLNQRDPIAPVLCEITKTLQNSNNVWLVGFVPAARSNPLPPPPLAPPPNLATGWWWGAYLDHWLMQVETHLLQHSMHEESIEIPVARPVNHLECLPVSRFSGFRAGAVLPKQQ